MKVKDIIVSEATLGAYIPGKSAVIKDPAKGVEYNLDLTKPENMAALKPNDKGELEYDPTPELGAKAPTAGEPTLAPGAEITIKSDEDISFNGVTQHDNGDMSYNAGPMSIRKSKDGSTDAKYTVGDTDIRMQQNPIGVKTLSAKGSMADAVTGVDASAQRLGVDPRKVRAQVGTSESVELEAMLRIAGLR